jgi:Domain of unknown function (DUF6916)
MNVVTNATCDLQTLMCESFAECRGKPFRIHHGAAAPLETELIAVTSLQSRLGGPGQPARREPFSVIFRGPPTPVLPQLIYRIENDSLGTFDLFIVPIGPDESGMRYEAVFN